MKKIALYLPQFHCIPENDEWWGKGFTEWTNVKKAKSLFKGHNQPEIPLNNNYYDLSEVTIMEKQAELAMNYGIDGFCYYHYWFEGKLLLEKPLENMLKDKKVCMPFMLCWANETWSRTWTGSETEVLISQNYSESESEWEQHFNYLLKFFQDERYIKHDNKPVLILYKPQLIKNVYELVAYWNMLARKAGFDGIYFGYQHHTAFLNKDVPNIMDFGVEFEPWFTVQELENQGYKENLVSRVIRKILGHPKLIDYDLVWNSIVNRPRNNKSVMPGAFTGWDNTPRRGKTGVVFYKSTPEKFGNYFKGLCESCDNEFIFINAWNEWAEGAHLEPDEKNGFGYLEAIKRCSNDE